MQINENFKMQEQLKMEFIIIYFIHFILNLLKN